MKKFYNFTKVGNTNNLYVYGAIVDGVDKWDETDVTFKDFQDKLAEIKQGQTLNIYVNSPGGSVFTTQAITSMLRRSKSNGVTINAYIDGLGASCGSWLPCVADNVYIYPQSVMMIHKPMGGVLGNADEMKQQIEILDKIENDVIIPLYLEKAKDGVTKEQLQDLMAKETWLSANEIIDLFNFTLLNENKEITCCIDKNIFKNYFNVPTKIKNILEEGEKMNNEDIKNEDLKKEENSEEEIENPTDTETNDVNIEDKKKKKKCKNSTNSEANESEEDKDLEDKGVIEDKKKKKKCKNESNDLEEENQQLKSDLEKVNALVLELSNKIEAMKPIVDKYEQEEAERIEEKNRKAKEEKINYYKNKFESLNALDKFESEEVKNLLENCITDEKATSKLNSIIVDLIANSINKKETRTIKPIVKSNLDKKLENLIPNDKISAYGFK